MSNTVWYKHIAKIQPYVFKILTPHGSGTGFQLFRNDTLCGIATAYHVIAASYEWEQPIKVVHADSGVTKMLKPLTTERTIFPHPTHDLAFMIFNHSDFPSFTEIPELVEPAKALTIGNEIGWLGFPSVAPDSLSFFNGHISYYMSKQRSYLIDGIAINGVSGGPAFFIKEETQKLHICGVISNYFPNRATGEVLPGMSMMRAVEPYHADLRTLRSLDEARQKAEEQAKIAQNEKNKIVEQKSGNEEEKVI